MIFRDRLVTDEEKSRFNKISRSYLKIDNDDLYFTCKLKGGGVYMESVDYGAWHQSTLKHINQCRKCYLKYWRPNSRTLLAFEDYSACEAWWTTLVLLPLVKYHFQGYHTSITHVTQDEPDGPSNTITNDLAAGAAVISFVARVGPSYLECKNDIFDVNTSLNLLS